MGNRVGYILSSLTIFSIIIMFVVQAKVETLQDEILKTESEIALYQDQIQLLEVEWVYLTRPERLRILATNYLQNNGYALASQIKGIDKLEKYYLANHRNVEDNNDMGVREYDLAKNEI